MTEQCCKRVFKSGGSLQGEPCKGKASHEYEGLSYCAAHYPPNAKARREKSNHAWEEKRAAERKAQRDSEITAEVRRRCEEWVRDSIPARYELIKREVEESVR